MKLSIRWKIILIIILPIVGIYLSVMIFNMLRMQQWTTNNVEQRMRELTSSYVNRFAGHLREAAQIAEITAAYVKNNPRLDSDQIYALLETNLNQYLLVYGSAVAFEPYKYQPNVNLFVRYVYRDGDTLRQADPVSTGYDYTETKQDYWHIPKTTGKPTWTEPYFDEGAGNILMATYSVPFYRDGKFTGIATVDIPLEPLRELVDLDISKDIKFTVISKAGKYVYSPYPERINKSIFEIGKQDGSEDLLKLLSNIASGKTGMEKLSGWTSDEREWIFYEPVELAQWGFVASITEKLALSAVQEQFNRNLYLLIISLVLIIASLWFLSVQISRPISQLSNVVSEIARGNLNVRAEMKRNDEIGELAGAFNEMSQKLSEREQALQEYSEQLKEMVEERERLNEELEQKNRELEQIVYVTSHDLRSPLVNIHGYSKELENSIKEIMSTLENKGVSSEIMEKIDPFVKSIPESYEFISSSISRMELLLNGLLQFSRSGRVELKREGLDMNRLMSSVFTSFEFQAKEKGAKLEISELPPCIGDEIQINQVFSNLIGNALKYLDHERLGIIRVSGNREDGLSVYCVEDNGIGIAPEYHKKIFEIFNQLDPAIGGEGLGLSIVHRMLERHNGKIWIESEEDNGSRFYISLHNA